MKIVLWLIGGFIAFVVIGNMLPQPSPSYGGSSSGNSEANKFTNAAQECWKTYEKKSNTPAEKVSIASFCEGLEQRAKSGQ